MPQEKLRLPTCEEPPALAAARDVTDGHCANRINHSCWGLTCTIPARKDEDANVDSLVSECIDRFLLRFVIDRNGARGISKQIKEEVMKWLLHASSVRAGVGGTAGSFPSASGVPIVLADDFGICRRTSADSCNGLRTYASSLAIVLPPRSRRRN